MPFTRKRRAAQLQVQQHRNQLPHRWLSLVALSSWVLTLPTVVDAGAGCAILNNCNGHGLCRTSYSSCECFTGWGATTDIAEYKAPDCSLSKLHMMMITMVLGLTSLSSD